MRLTTAMLDDVATGEVAAARIGVSVPTIWRWVRHGRLHARRVLGRAVIDRAEVEAVARERAGLAQRGER
jgi:excisionase family DNA binding protein